MAAPTHSTGQECDFLEERNPSKQLAAQHLAGAGEREVGKLLIVKGVAQDQHICDKKHCHTRAARGAGVHPRNVHVDDHMLC